MEEAVLCFHQVVIVFIRRQVYSTSVALQHIMKSSGPERRMLEDGLHAIQRHSGSTQVIPDMFTITSIDVIIHHGEKLGSGGFAAVYKGDWRGEKVAVKVLEKGLPRAVRD